MQTPSLCIFTSPRGCGKVFYREKMKALYKEIIRRKFLSIMPEEHIKSLAKPYNTYAILNRILYERGNNDTESTRVSKTSCTY